MKRKGWVFWVVAAIQVSAACCWLCSSKTSGNAWLLQSIFNSKKESDFIVRQLKSVKNPTFTFCILEKLQFYFICTQMLNHPPVQGCGLSQLHAGCENCTPESKICWSPFLFCLEWNPEQYHREMCHSCSSVYDQRPRCFCVEADICQAYPSKKVWQIHTQLSFGDWMKNEPSSVWLVASEHTPHSDSKWQKTPVGHTARQEFKVLVSPEIPTYTHGHILRVGLTQISCGKPW